MSNHKHRAKSAITEEGKSLPEQLHATTHLNYHGKKLDIVGQVVGPNLLGENLTVVEAVYDPEADMTRAGLAYGIHELAQS